mgnify:CR=1 FL=1
MCEGEYGINELDEISLVSKMIGQKVENSEARLQNDDFIVLASSLRNGKNY